jgi:hypothetical protein
MGRTLRTQVALYLDKDKVAMLHKLAAKTGETKQAVLRKALDSMLIEHGILKVSKKS